MRAAQRAAEGAAKLYQKRPNEEILRLVGYKPDWQRQFESIRNLGIAEQLNLRNLLPIRAEEELRKIREEFARSPAVQQIAREMQGQADRSLRALRELTETAISPAMLSGYTSLNNMLKQIQTAAMGSLARTPEFASAFLAPTQQYSRFLEDTVTRLSVTYTEPIMSRALQGSILLAEDIFGSNAAITNTISDQIAEAANAPSIRDEHIVLPFVQRDELVAARESLQSLELADLVRYSSANRAARVANRIVQGIVNVNTERKLKAKAEIFTLTNRSFLAARDIVLIVARDTPSLGDFLDTLYILLYEAAGDDHLRYLVSEGGELVAEECEIVWIIKHLRNYARHDLDHGQPTDVQKKWRSLEADLRVLGFTRMPTTESEFRQLQGTLLQMADKFLALMRQRIQ